MTDAYFFVKLINGGLEKEHVYLLGYAISIYLHKHALSTRDFKFEYQTYASLCYFKLF